MIDVQKFKELMEQGVAFAGVKQYGEAEQSFQRALTVYPDSTEAITWLLQVHLDTMQYEKCHDLFEKLYALTNGNLTEQQHFLHRLYMRSTADWTHYNDEMSWYQKNYMSETIPFHALATPLSNEQIFEITKNMVHRPGFLMPKMKTFSFEKRTFKNRKINLAFFSANWHNHPEAFIIGELIENIDKEKFNLFLYDLEPMPDPNDIYKKRITEAGKDCIYTAANKMTDWQLAKTIYADGIDVVIDFHGLTGNNRLEVLTHQPAPVQASFLGYPGSLGAIQGIPCLFGDSYVVPKDVAKKYPETVINLDPCAYTYDRKIPIPTESFERSAFGLPEDAVVLCCFCNDYKYTPTYWNIWMNVLKQVPKAVLWMYATNSTFIKNLKKEAEACGVNSDRLYFAFRQPHQEHMARHRCADLFLDTQYYNAHTTAMESLWMDLPVITCPGDTWASRVCGSILTYFDMPELIAKNLKEYEDKIIFYASHPKELAALKSKVTEQKTKSPLFDSARFARCFESACLQMLDEYTNKHQQE